MSSDHGCHLLLLQGEPYQRRRALQKALGRLKDELDSPELHELEGAGLTPADLTQLLRGASLFNSTKLIHVTHLEELTDPQGVARVIGQADFKKQALVAEGEGIRGNSSLYRAFAQGETVKFDPLKKRNFPNRINKVLREKGVRVESGVVRWLSQVLELDLLRVEREAEKLSLYGEGRKLDLDEVRRVVWAQGGTKIFDFLDSFSSKDLSRALGLLEAMLKREVEPSKIFFMLAGEVRKLLKIKDLAGKGFNNGKIADKTGIYEWLVSKKRPQVDNFSRSELVRLFHALREKDREIKRGLTEPQRALFQLTYHFCS